MVHVLPLIEGHHSVLVRGGQPEKRRRLRRKQVPPRKFHLAFGSVVEGLTSADVSCPIVRCELHNLWRDCGGLLFIRGIKGLTPQQLVDLTAAFGEVEDNLSASRTRVDVPGTVGGAVMRVGNTRDPINGELNASFIRYDPIAGDYLAQGAPGFLEACQYNPITRRPTWHSDATFRARPPAGSVLYCRVAPSVGADTCWADATAALEALPPQIRARLETLEAVCSQAHHDADVHRDTPSYPLLTPERRLACPPVAVPLVLRHPHTGRKALYGMNRSTCFVRAAGGPMPTEEELARAEGPEAFEDPSVERELRALLPHATSPNFTLRWRWAPGDLAIWDNRSTMHCGTGYDDAAHVREMWRTTFHDPDVPPIGRILSR